MGGKHKKFIENFSPLSKNYLFHKDDDFSNQIHHMQHVRHHRYHTYIKQNFSSGPASQIHLFHQRWTSCISEPKHLPSNRKKCIQ